MPPPNKKEIDVIVNLWVRLDVPDRATADQAQEAVSAAYLQAVGEALSGKAAKWQGTKVVSWEVF